MVQHVLIMWSNVIIMLKDALQTSAIQYRNMQLDKYIMWFSSGKNHS